MITRQYHVVYQNGSDYFFDKAFEWHSGPMSQDEAKNKVDVLNSLFEDKTFVVAAHGIEMSFWYHEKSL